MADLPITTVREGTDATDMANAIFGDGVTIVGASYSGDIDSAGIYRDGDSTAGSATPGDTGVILSSGNVESYTRDGGDPNRATNTSANTTGQNNNADFNAAAGASTYDAAYLDVYFIATGDTMAMQFIFASE